MRLLVAAHAAATMDIMMRLTGSGFSAIATEFREREKRLGSGLPLFDFVEIVLQGLPRARTPEEKAENISALVDLFEDIDINGDGVMEFDEFTSFCVDAGMVATRSKVTTLKHRYVRDTKHVIKTANGSMGIEKIKWSPECRKFMVIENAAKAVKLFRADGALVAEVGVPTAAESVGTGTDPQDDAVMNDSRNATDPPRSPTTRNTTPSRGGNATAATRSTSVSRDTETSIFVLDAVFIPRYRWLAVSTTDFCISFFDMDESRNSAINKILPETALTRASASFELIKSLTITTPTAQLLLRHCAHSSLLVGSGNDFVINIWRIVDAEHKLLWKRLLNHQDMVMDFLEVPHHDLLVSCDLRRSIQLWENQNCRSRGSLVGHTRGVRQMVYSSQHDLLLSAGFEFEAYAWDLGSRQIVMKLTGHRAPLVGVQLALFQTERAITADAQGVFKVWDISRNSSVYGSATSSSSSRSGGGMVGAMTHAVQLESIEPSLQFARFEPMTFVCLHPHSRDLWTSTAGSSTLHRFQSKRIQQFDDIPLSSFYHYNANKFVVVTGTVCSVWDGETGACAEEFTHVGNVGAGDFDRDQSAGADSNTAGGQGAGGKGNNHNGSESGQGQEATSEILVCAHDAKCRKLVIVSELGFMGVFNCLNFVQMRQCMERFTDKEVTDTSLAVSRSASSHIVGLHYCSDNKLVIATDAASSAIIVIDDNVGHDSVNGTKRTPVLRRVTNIPDGISTSAYSYHASMVATVGNSNELLISLWDFETLTLVAQCRFEDEEEQLAEEGSNGSRIQLLQFWDEFPVLFAADTRGRILVFAVMPLIHAYAGKLLHVFANTYTDSTSKESPDCETYIADAGATSEHSPGKVEVNSEISKTFITEAAETAAQKLLLRSRKKKLSTVLEPSDADKEPTIPRKSISSVVTTMRVMFDETEGRYVLFSGDDNGHVALWDLSHLAHQLALTKIPEIKRKCMRRGYHPKATFSRDYSKEGKSMLAPQERKHHQAVFQGDWRRSMLIGEDMADMDVRAAQMDLKRLSRRRLEIKKRPTTASPGLNIMKQQQAPLPSPSAKVKPEAAVDSALVAAEAFLGGGHRKSFQSILSSNGKNRKPSSSSLLISSSSKQGLNAPGANQRISSSPLAEVSELISVLFRWQAHHDAITSVEVTRNPNILVTCSLDTRVYVWNWRGECLGKLFDAENIGNHSWMFRKNDTKRQQERDQIIHELMRELDLTPHQKLQRRRQTLYEEHVGRRSQAELQHVNAMLLDHIISKNPELELMESAAKKAVTETGDAESSSSSHLTDTEINAALERSRQRNLRAKLTMLTQLQGSTTAATKKKLGGRSVNMMEVAAQKQAALRMKSLSQVGPLLCVNRFDYRSEPNQVHPVTKRGSVSASAFVDKGDIRIDKAYLEQELSISTDKTTSDGINGSSVAVVQSQIHSEHLAAAAVVEHRTTLERKARDMYSNFEASKRRHGKDKLPVPASPTKSLMPSESHANLTLPPGTAELLEPSDFLKKHLPASALALRPQTAPIKRLKESNCTKSAASIISNNSPGQQMRLQGMDPRSRLGSSESAPALPHPSLSSAFHDGRTGEGDYGIRMLGANRRKSSLDELFLGEVGRQSRSPVPLSIVRAEENGAVSPVEHETLEHQHNNTKSSMQKLMGINSIISRAQDYSIPTSQDQQYKTRGENEEVCTIDEETIRGRLEQTKDRMLSAMHDGEWQSSRLLVKKQRQAAMAHKKQRRMEDYLQQKRREMNTGISNVFKQTSLAFQSSAADDPKTARRRAVSASSPGKLGSGRRKSKVQQEQKRSAFGIYSAREIMSVIRLFWLMDEDVSGSISLPELQQYKHFFDKLGHNDLATVFQAIDKDGSGTVSLRELLEVCFQYATSYQLDEMLKLAKLGSVRSYLQGDVFASESTEEGSTTGPPGSKNLAAEHKRELMQIFRLFDANGDGGVSMQEIMEALRVDDDDVMATVMTQQRPKEGTGGLFTSGITRDDVEKLYKEFDRDSDAVLDFDEFVALMRSLYGPRVNPNQ